MLHMHINTILQLQYIILIKFKFQIQFLGAVIPDRRLNPHQYYSPASIALRVFPRAATRGGPAVLNWGRASVGGAASAQPIPYYS